MTPAIDEKINSFLAKRHENGTVRSLKPTTRAAAPFCEIRGQKLIDFSSNDYLSLSRHPALAKEAAAWLEKFGTSFSASRLVCGTSPEILDLESRIAAWKGTEAAIVVGSGYLANCGAIPALAGRKTAIFADKLNHASLNAGCMQSGADFKRYRHLDMEHLDSLLRNSHAAEKLIVSDTVFSMDGDVADCTALYGISKRHNAFLYLDDAHATGVFGGKGEGSPLDFIEDLNDVIAMGTFSKGMGAYGAYLAGTKRSIDFLVNACGSFIYSTALPPAAYGAISAAVELVQTEKVRRDAKKLLENAEKLREELRRDGLDCGPGGSQIIPLIVGESSKALDVSEKLLADGILAIAIRPPTVPENSARIRLSLNVSHGEKEMTQLIAAIRVSKTS